MKISEIPFKRKYFLIWLGICYLSAVPSFYLASSENHSILAMLLGIMLFVLGYTIVCSSSFYDWIKSHKIIYRSLKFSFVIRLLISIFALISIVSQVDDFTAIFDGNLGHITSPNKDDVIPSFAFILSIYIDGLAGILTYSLIEGLTGLNLMEYSGMRQQTVDEVSAQSLQIGFMITLLATIIQGILLNIVILLIMLAAAIVQLPFAWVASLNKIEQDKEKNSD